MPDATPHLLRAEAHVLAALDELDEAVRALTADPATRPQAVDVQRRRQALSDAAGRGRRGGRRVRRTGVL